MKKQDSSKPRIEEEEQPFPIQSKLLPVLIALGVLGMILKATGITS